VDTVGGFVEAGLVASAGSVVEAASSMFNIMMSELQ
jgi:hypothetical protein